MLFNLEINEISKIDDYRGKKHVGNNPKWCIERTFSIKQGVDGFAKYIFKIELDTVILLKPSVCEKFRSGIGRKSNGFLNKVNKETSAQNGEKETQKSF